MMNAGANALTGFLNKIDFPARVKTSWHCSPPWIQAPDSARSAASAIDTGLGAARQNTRTPAFIR
jgi:hypothetical protein